MPHCHMLDAWTSWKSCSSSSLALFNGATSVIFINVMRHFSLTSVYGAINKVVCQVRLAVCGNASVRMHDEGVYYRRFSCSASSLAFARGSMTCTLETSRHPPTEYSSSARRVNSCSSTSK